MSRDWPYPATGILGLRGPVLRGWATVLELRVGADAGGRCCAGKSRLGRRTLSQAPAATRRTRYSRSRDRRQRSARAGGTVDGSRRAGVIYRWKNALNGGADSLDVKKDLTRLVTVPFGATKDHAEGIRVSTNAACRSWSVTTHRMPFAHRQGWCGREGGHLRGRVMSVEAGGARRETHANRNDGSRVSYRPGLRRLTL